MVNKSKIKGTAAESAVRDFLREHGYPYCERLSLSGSKDRGDLTGIDPRVVVEVKAAKELDLGPWMRETEQERLNAGAEIGLLVVKRRLFASPKDWFWISDGETMATLLNGYTHG